MSPVSPTNSSEGSSSDDEVVLGEDDDLVDTATSANTLGSLNPKLEEHGNGMDLNEEKQESMISEFGEKDLASKLQSFGLSENLSLFQQSQDENSIPAMEPPDWMSGLRETAPSLEGTSGRDMDSENNSFEVHVLDKPYPQGDDAAPSGFLSNAEITPGPPVISPVLDAHDSIRVDSNMINPLMGEELAGVESDGTAKAMEKMLKEGVVGEAGPIHAKETAHLIDPDSGSKDNLIVDPNFNDVNFWRSDYPHSVTEDEQL